VKLWRMKIVYHIPRCQARIRRRIAARRWKESLMTVNKSATSIQKSIRMYLAQCLAGNMKREIAASVIQRCYRSLKQRLDTAYLKLRSCTTVIQKVSRRKLARNFVKKQSEEMNDASIQIQKCWRGHVSRSRRSAILVEKCSKDLCNYVLILDSEIAHHKMELDKLSNKSVEIDMLESEGGKNKLTEMKSSLHTSEQNSVDLQRMKTHMTPTSVGEGWEEQINQSLQHERTVTTNMKLEMVLNLGKRLKVSQRQCKEFRERQNTIVDKIDTLQRDRENLSERLQTYQRERSKREAALKARQKIADEKRRWEVSHRVPSGKPKNLSNISTLSSQFCSGSVNLFANEDPYEDPMERLVDRIALQSYVSQLQHFDAMLKPLESFRK